MSDILLGTTRQVLTISDHMALHKVTDISQSLLGTKASQGHLKPSKACSISIVASNVLPSYFSKNEVHVPQYAFDSRQSTFNSQQSSQPQAQPQAQAQPQPQATVQ
jgi:hypothetical protein